MTKDELSTFLNQEGDGRDLDNHIREVHDRIQETLVAPMFRVEEVKSDNWLYNLLIDLIADADEILAAYHFAQQKKEILQIVLGQATER